ncbi:protein SHOOT GRAVITROPISM 5-like [Chenopodium quinoa]|uniref:protein SHOOT GRAVITROPISM 5-like n=1 Tax=Chenopodium quinoa TaxID=63459 RepID=UPI000B794989|nr:protein SHOOT GRAVITROPISM 5-like [Chenopodium quinoa]
MLGGSSSSSAPSSEHINMGGSSPADNGNSSKRKRRPAGTPDPDAEVVSLSPKTLLESDRYVCEICNQGFQRDQNLQMHRRRHKVPWKLLKRENPAVKKRVFVCPEPTCLHHDPCHALGDLVGIKKHFRRKHSNHKQWVCDKCSKAYAVQSDYKAHLKTCGTRGHSCDCGRVFSRVESFIEHQDACHMGRLRSTDHHQPGDNNLNQLQQHHQQQHQQQPTVCLSRAASSSSPSNDATNNNNVNVAGPWRNTGLTMKTATTTMSKPSLSENLHNLELQLSVSPKATDHENQSTQLQLSIGSTSDMGEKNATAETNSKSNNKAASASSPSHQTTTLKEQASEQLKLAMAEKAYAEDARREAKRQIELAEREFANAKRIKQQAQAELDKAQTLKDHAMKQISATLMQITCHACKQQFHASPTTTTTATTYALHLEDQNSSLAESQVEDENNLQ